MAFAHNFAKIAPWVNAAALGATTGASVADQDRKKGAMRGALVGLGALASGRFSGLATEKILKKVLGNKVNLSDELFALKMSGADKKTVIEWLRSKNLPIESYKELKGIIGKTIIARPILNLGVGAASTAGIAYALKNDSNSKE